LNKPVSRSLAKKWSMILDSLWTARQKQLPFYATSFGLMKAMKTS